MKEQPKEQPVAKKMTLSVFGDDGDKEEDLFVAAAKTKSKDTKTAAPAAAANTSQVISDFVPTNIIDLGVCLV